MITAVAVKQATVEASAGGRVLQARGLVKTYRMDDVEVHALQGIDLDLRA